MRALFSRTEFSAINRYFADLMLKLSGSRDPEFYLACALVSYRAERGDVCLNLADYAETPVLKGFSNPVPGPICPPLQSWVEMLRKSPVVGKPGGKTPLILDDTDRAPRLYLLRYWQYENDLAAGIRQRIEGQPTTLDRELLTSGLNRLFPGNNTAPDMQAMAARTALEKNLCIITGGPGTGKTATVLKILILLLEQAGDIPLKLALVAPTGKAANRLRESIRSSLDQLDRSVLASETVLSAIPTETSTIHRLLGSIKNSPRFRYDRLHPLPHDCVIVDEVSMVDLALMSKLVEALKPSSRLILLGDKNQLSSVESGSVLGDICFDPGPSGRQKSSPLSHTIVNLVKSYRFDEKSGIGQLSMLINDGQAEESLALLRQGSAGDLGWKRIPAPGELKPRLEEIFRQVSRRVIEPRSPAQAFQNVSRFGILCALRNGPSGAVAINRLVESLLAEAGQIPADSPWYPGRPVMITRNDYQLQLFNGDIGVALPDSEDDNRLKVFFDLGENRYRKIAPARMPEHESAFAMTIHKSQGSEFSRVLLILADQDIPVLSRELIYTGITRARDYVEIWGEEKVFVKAVLRRTERSSGLSDALAG